ncbi:MAG: manganese-dependent inorganic pyrophosphatase [Candidatus Aenigmarchaeota archaeon]|nr:manganese-dependent inorganic pyrophosphatase [Candidatus Aenigmarchaeota archaeon]
MEEKIYIIGHKNPDTDSICSAIAYAELKKKQGDKREIIPARSGDINDETGFILKKFNIDPPSLLKDATGKKIILVDHSEPKQRPENSDKGEIIEVIDHHNINFQQATPILFHAEPLGSTSTIIARMYFEKNIDIEKGIAGILLGAIISDTVIFRSPITTQEDKDIAQKLKPIAEVDDLEAFGIEMFKAKSNWKEKSAHDIINTDYKEYELGGKNIGISQIETVDTSDLKERKDEFIEIMEHMSKERNLDTIIVLLTDIIKEGCLAFISGNSLEQIGKTFGKEIKDNEIYLPGVLSRKKQIVPPLEKAFSQ